jgi:hypothetical protein
MKNLKKFIHNTKHNLREHINDDEYELIEEVSKVLNFVSLNE